MVPRLGSTCYGASPQPQQHLVRSTAGRFSLLQSTWAHAEGRLFFLVTEGCMHWVIRVAFEDPNQSSRLDPAEFLRIRKIRAIRHQKLPEYGWILLFLRQRQFCIPGARGGYYMSYLEQDMLVWTPPLSAASAY